MASVVTNIVIGDYRYTLYDDQTAEARVTDRTKSSYGAFQSSVTHEGVTYALTSVYHCFAYCTSLTTAPSIPSSVTNIQDCFFGCTALTTAPTIPSSVTNMADCFYDCTSLTGTIAVYGTPTYYSSCFRNTTLPIVLAVSDSTETPTWQAIAATGNNGNVTVRDVSANPAPTATITAVRVASSDSTTPDETGQYAYVTVRTTASTEQAPDNVAQAPTITLDGETYTPADPSGTATFTCHVSLGNDLGHVIGATPRDTYKTGTEVTVTLASTYSPMEFHATPVYDEHGELKGYIGGDGAAFGQHATRAGWLDVAWNMDVGGDADVHGNVSADGALSCADGSPYCSDGTNVKVGGATVGSADNLSYVASEDTLRVPTMGIPTKVNVSSMYLFWAKSGHVVTVGGSLNATVGTSNAVLLSGFPPPLTGSGTTSVVRIMALHNLDGKSCQLDLTSAGQLKFETDTQGTGWYMVNFCYMSVS